MHLSKQDQARLVAREVKKQFKFTFEALEDLLAEAYLRGRADERVVCKEIAANVRRALDL